MNRKFRSPICRQRTLQTVLPSRTKTLLRGRIGFRWELLLAQGRPQASTGRPARGSMTSRLSARFSWTRTTPRPRSGRPPARGDPDSGGESHRPSLGQRAGPGARRARSGFTDGGRSAGRLPGTGGSRGGADLAALRVDELDKCNLLAVPVGESPEEGVHSSSEEWSWTSSRRRSCSSQGAEDRGGQGDGGEARPRTGFVRTSSRRRASSATTL